MEIALDFNSPSSLIFDESLVYRISVELYELPWLEEGFVVYWSQYNLVRFRIESIKWYAIWNASMNQCFGWFLRAMDVVDSVCWCNDDG